MLNVSEIRADFPIFKRRINGRRLVYLDNAATTQKPEVVINAISQFYTSQNANIHRAVHTLAVESTQLFEKTRQKIADFIGAASSREIVFVKNATEAANLLANSLSDLCQPGDRILLTQVEHHSNLIPWRVLARKNQLEIDYLGIDSEGNFDLEKIKELVGDKTKIVSFTHVSNILGVVNPVVEMVRLVKKINPGVLVVVDGSQAVPHLPVNLQKMKADFYFFTGHKMLGPTGVGVLWGREELLNKLPPFEVGSEMVLDVDFNDQTWNELPWKFEPGTPNISSVVGLSAAIDYLNKIGMSNIVEHQKKITQYAIDKLSEFDEIDIISSKNVDRQVGIISFNFANVHPHDVALILDSEGIAVRSGHHCAKPLLLTLGFDAVVRASFYLYNDFDDVDSLVGGLKKVRKVFKTKI